MSSVSIVSVEEDRVDQRLDNFLRYHLVNVPKSRIYRIIRKGEVRVNGKRAKADTRLKAGDQVRIPPIEYQQRHAASAPSASQQLRLALKKAIVFEDDSLIAINKPSGLAVHGGTGLKLGLIEALRSDRDKHESLELVHRLDRETSGIVLIAKKRKALVALQDEFREKNSVQKTYWCLVKGHWAESTTSIDAPLLRLEESASGERRVVVDPSGKPSETSFRVLKHLQDMTWLEATPVTGRTHQIRVHCQFQGAPILGDDKYQDEVAEQLASKIGLKRLFLHAVQLKIPHPVSRELMTFQAPLDAKLKSLLQTNNPR